MHYRQLGVSGLTVSVVGLGCNNFRSRIDDGAAQATVEAALDAGVTLFDTADIYGGRGGSEEVLGRALADRRHRVAVATKFGGDMGDGSVARGSRRYVHSAVEASLRRLRTDWIDLYQMHFPDPLTPIEETIAALDELVSEGKVRHVGSSNFDAWQVVDADWLARDAHRTRFISAQNQYNLLERDVERELVPACLRAGVGVLPYFPLARGLLTGKYRRGQEPPAGTRLTRNPHELKAVLTDALFNRLEALEAFANERGHTLLDLAIAGLAAQPAVGSVIAGASSPEQLRANVAAGEWVLSADDLSALRRLLDA
jgi:aryl-alcohol dehydrogenase-like predicted oxidoreductase